MFYIFFRIYLFFSSDSKGPFQLCLYKLFEVRTIPRVRLTHLLYYDLHQLMIGLETSVFERFVFSNKLASLILAIFSHAFEEQISKRQFPRATPYLNRFLI